jgi:O-antigen ligase
MTLKPPTNVKQESSSQVLNAARVLLIGYAVVLPFKGTASLQAALLIAAFVLLLWDRRQSLGDSWQEAIWILAPLLCFSIWVFMIAPFWKAPVPLDWDPGSRDVHQPWYSLNLWRRDIAQPMLAFLCAYWAFRSETWKEKLGLSICIFLIVLMVQCLRQFYWGEVGVDGVLNKGTIWVRGFSRDVIFLGYVLLLLTPIILWLVFTVKGGWKKIAAWVCFIVLLYLIFLVKRRGTWIALYAEFFVIACWLGKRTIIPLMVASLLMLAAAYHLRPEWFVRDYDKKDDKISRVNLVDQIKPLVEKHPWVGVGFGKDTVIKNYWMHMHQHTHNSFINMMLAIGIPGLMVWLAALTAFGRRFWCSRNTGWTAKIGFAFLIAFCVRGLTDDVWQASNAELFWFYIGIFHPSWKEASCQPV